MSRGSIAKVCHLHSNGEEEYPRQPTIERKCTTHEVTERVMNNGALMAANYASSKLTSYSPADACLVAKTLASYEIGAANTTKTNICMDAKQISGGNPSVAFRSFYYLLAF
ncbi:uncharacterized protein ARMOST_14726 [Armillaria ostoyae]|uniref:Uncharacterized protein n=1 Tax=Armillaria ostoyae TaxID=47428 RepID=A0A284RRF0_ARMOS|nr:uncharacterized protein ARMOST_14726 [Armillaria ostoyae]